MLLDRYRQKLKNRKTSWHCPFYAHAFWYINFVYRFGSLGEKWGVARELLSSMIMAAIKQVLTFIQILS